VLFEHLVRLRLRLDTSPEVPSRLNVFLLSGITDNSAPRPGAAASESSFSLMLGTRPACCYIEARLREAHAVLDAKQDLMKSHAYMAYAI
jgi:hypothetical protein